MEPLTIGLLAWTLSPLPLAFLWLRSRRRAARADATYGALSTRVAPVTDLDAELARLTRDCEEKSAEIVELRRSYAEKRGVLSQLEGRLAVYDERLSFAELGVYEPHFDFGDSEAYKARIKTVRDLQKRMIAAKDATECPTEWEVGGSKSKGRTMISRQTRLTLRAFNNECEAAIANTRWNNAVAMEKRILNAKKQIDAANDSLNLVIRDSYAELKLEELRLTHEYREQLQAEKEERAELARAEREEKKLLAEAAAAERKELEYRRLLDLARSEAGADQGRIAELERELAEAHAAHERARSMAELTRSGYVYVISNIGSFGEEVVKIGMTRRLDPDDRVRELGDASVPFRFDTHAMIYSEDAPGLETALHKAFAEQRINMSNMRKEFFRVGLDEVEAAVMRLSPAAEFHKDREAQEWHETLARRRAVLLPEGRADEPALPVGI